MQSHFPKLVLLLLGLDICHVQTQIKMVLQIRHVVPQQLVDYQTNS